MNIDSIDFDKQKVINHLRIARDFIDTIIESGGFENNWQRIHKVFSLIHRQVGMASHIILRQQLQTDLQCQPITLSTATSSVKYYKALANQKRLIILKLLEGKDLCVGEIVQKLKLRQSNISQHLHLLRQVGLVDMRRQGKNIVYHLIKGVR
jgi:DNA-binding HxlR family transcriptional regulator